MQKNILLINLGSPKSLQLKDVRAYLSEFLSDKFVIDLPKLLQQIIVRLIILPFRSPKTRKTYKAIWNSKGSPLIQNTNQIAQSLIKQTGWNVKVAMRYQEPSIKDSILSFKNKKVNDIIIIPLYPHTAMSTTHSTKVEVDRIIKKYYPDLRYSIIKPFFDHPKYINALSEQLKPHISDNMDKFGSLYEYHQSNNTEFLDPHDECYVQLCRHNLQDKLRFAYFGYDPHLPKNIMDCEIVRALFEDRD